MSTSKPAKGIPVPSKIPKSGPDSGTHSRSSSVSNLTTASDVHSEMGDATSENTHGFKVEDRVWVNGSKPGVIKFLGKTDFAPGLWAGVLLDDLIGKNDGSVAGVKYFTCEPLRGIFARPSKLTRTAGDVPTATIDSAKSPRTGSAATPLSSRLAGSTASLSSARSTCCSRLRCGERVMVSSTTGMKPGILRFLGETDFAKGEWAGIELDEPVGKNDGSVAGKRYFTCRMKYGLFSPLHKVSRAGGTATPRAPSVRGTPLMRSTSRDSLSSSVSNSSKLKARSTGGVGVMTTSRALEEALREKEQHIEQLLKEHEMERAEIAKVSVRCEEFANKCSELLDQQQNAEKDKKEIEVQLVSEKRKIEDLQFQLDEEKIIKSDLETQMSQHKQLLERLEGYLNKKMDAKFINIKEILERKEKLTEVSDEQSHDPQIEVYKEKIASLQSGLANSIAEKDEILKTLEATKLLIDTSKSENEGQMSSLKATIQEKDDIISNLKGELTTQLEKLTQFIEDNKNLNDQINLQAAEAKGQTDEIIKEMGEKIKSQTEELNAKNTQIQEHESSLQEKDSQLSEHSNRLQSQAQQLTEAQNQNKALQDDLGQKISELNEKATKLSSLEGEISALKSQLSSTAGEKDEKILSLGKEIGLLTNNLQEQEVKFVQKQTEVCNLEDTVKELSEINTKILGELKEKEEYVSTVSKDSCEKMAALQTEIKNLKQEREDAVNNLEKELQTKKAEYEKLSQDISEKTTALSEKESRISSLSQTLSQKESEFTNLQNELSSVKQTCEVLSNEKVQSLDSIKTKEELLSELEKQLNDLKSSEEKTRNDILETQKEVETLQIALKLKNEENDQLNSKLELAEKNVEMLNKDSSQHVMTLQSELSKLKEENIKDKTAFDQKISELENENSKLSKDINEKNAALTEKTGVLSSFKQELHAKEDRVSNLTTRIESLEQELSALSKAKEDLIISHSKELGSTKGQLESELKIKDAKLSEIQEEYEKLTKTLTEKNSALQANEEALTALQVQIKEKESDMLNTSALSEKLEEELDALSKDKQSIIEEHQKQVEAIKEKHKLELKKKDELLEEFQSKISTSNELLENKDKALLQKESENNALKNALQNKDSQFDEISKMIEGSQAQLLQLTERNENNEKLLQTKEAFINDFKAEKERQILELEEKFKGESSKLQELLQKQESDIKEKSDIISKLNSEAENQMKEINHLSEELTKSKDANEKSLMSSSEIHKEFTAKIADLEVKYTQVLEEKKKIAAEEQMSREAKKNLEETKDSLLQEKMKREEIVKDREAQLQALQEEVNRMQTNFTLHKQELQKKLDVSQLELEAAQELKRQLELQHSVLEELQQELHNSEEKCKSLEEQVKTMTVLTSDNSTMSKKLEEFEKREDEKNKKIASLTEEYEDLEESLKGYQSSLNSKKEECTSLNEKLKDLKRELESKDALQKSIKSLEQENILLKFEVDKLEKAKSEKNANQPAGATTNSSDAEERETLQSQVDFLNSIIVDMKQKNENLQLEVEALKMAPVEIDLNLNSVEKKLAPRLFCDICDVFDLHETDDCPKQESFIADEEVPHLLPQGARKMEERPYCNTCEIFGHWTYDCQAEEEY